MFSIQECNNIIELSNSLTETQRDDSDRGISYSYWNLLNKDNTRWIFDRFDRFLEDQESLKVVKQLDAIQMFRYRKGNSFTRHSDIYYPKQAYNVGVNLTDDYEGGDFILYKPDLVLKKERGKLYSFFHTREHEVTSITEGERWSLIGFYFYDNIDKKQPSI